MHNIASKFPVSSFISSAQKSHLIKQIKTEWTLPLAVRDTALLHHFILYWSAKYLVSSIDNNRCYQPDSVYKEGRNYKVVYKDCTAEEVAALASNDANAQVALSFRVPKHELNMPPIVLVSCSPSIVRTKNKMHKYWEHK